MLYFFLRRPRTRRYRRDGNHKFSKAGKKIPRKTTIIFRGNTNKTNENSNYCYKFIKDSLLKR